MAIVRVEADPTEPAQVLLRVTTVDDVTQGGAPPPGGAFADADAALAYLRTWLDCWLADPARRRGDAPVT
jgi:hypothetical protein